MCRDDDLLVLPEAPQDVDQAEEVDGIQALKRIIQHR